MTKEQKFFIQVLSDHLNGRKTKSIEGIDWAVIQRYARNHQVDGIIYTQVKDIMPEDQSLFFRKSILSIYFYNFNRDNDIQKIKEDLNRNNIPFFIVKGPEVAKLYPIPGLRTMGDIDLVVHRTDREKCHDIFLQIGYRCISKQDDREWQYYKNTMEIELHDRLVYDEAVNETGHDVFFNDCWKYYSDGQIDWSFHLLFLIFHLRKHFMNAGVGFRMFMDLAVVAQKVDVDWKWLKDNLNTTGMLKFAEKCYGFVYKWFGIKTKLMTGIDDDFFQEATQKIFADGVFGFSNTDNADSSVINQIKDDRFGILGMVRVAFRHIFPARSDIKDIEPYTYLKKHPMFLPLSWVHRGFRGIRKHKTGIGIYRIKHSFVSKDRVAHRKSMLKKWGL